MGWDLSRVLKQERDTQSMNSGGATIQERTPRRYHADLDSKVRGKKEKTDLRY